MDGSNGDGIWAEDPQGLLTLIARTGDLLDVDDGTSITSRTIRSLSFIDSFANQGPSGFNDLGQLAFFASFTDGTSGLFVSNLAAVPEPTTFLMLAVSGLLGLSATRRREQQ